MMQRSHGFVTRTSRLPMAMRVHVSSAHGAQSLTTTFGRKRSMGSGAAPFDEAAIRTLRSASDDMDAMSIGNESANPTMSVGRAYAGLTGRRTSSGMKTSDAGWPSQRLTHRSASGPQSTASTSSRQTWTRRRGEEGGGEAG